MIHLLEVNILIALGDSSHVFFEPARRWFLSHARDGWATCPLTENGFVRILGQPAYTGFPGDAAQARIALRTLKNFPGHQFWPDDLSLTDLYLYLLALAVSHQARFVTLDARVDPNAIRGGAQAYVLISSSRA